MSRRKLQEIGLALPMLPMTSVGSLPQIGNPTEALVDWIRAQEGLGLDVLVDGEQDRQDLVAHLVEGIDGFRRGELVRTYGNAYHRKPVIAGPLGWRAPVTVASWRKAQDLTEKPVKAVLAGPYTLAQWSFDEHYADPREALAAVAGVLRREVEALVESGARIVQFDEPALSVRPRDIPQAAEALGLITSGLPAYFVCHICEGRFAELYPAILDLPVDNLSLETSGPSATNLDHFHRHPFRLDITLGVLNVRTAEPETSEQVASKLRDALSILPLDKIWVSPDCGLKSRSREEALAKLQAMVAGVKETRRLIAPHAF